MERRRGATSPAGPGGSGAVRDSILSAEAFVKCFVLEGSVFGKFFPAAAVLAAFLAGSVCVSTAQAVDLVVETGSDGIAAGPISLAPEKPLDASSAYFLVDGSGKIAAQTDENGRLYWWTDALPAGKTVTYRLQPGEVRDRVKLEKGDEQVRVLIDGKLLTVLNFKKDEPKVYLYPVIGPTGAGVTRDYVMRDNALERENKRQDHHHHRSMWTAYGDVRIRDFDRPGYDFWAEPRDRKIPPQVLTRIIRMVGGPVFGRIEVEIEWRTPEGQRVFTEDRTYTFFAGSSDQRVIDVRNVFKFNDMDVKFGDTKEGGILSLRLAVTMDERGIKQPQELHGQMTNSKGGVAAKECWGKAAEWCDYVGPLEGKTVGVAVFDHPKNFRHPTHWHIRDYGLYTANPFGLAAFSGDKSKNGSHVFRKGESVEFNYRVIIHQGDTSAAHIPEQWDQYSVAPKIRLQ